MDKRRMSFRLRAKKMVGVGDDVSAYLHAHHETRKKR